MKKKSKLGYKRYSPDVNNPYNIIPSGRITMKDVDFPVYGVDNFGNSQTMYPGREYQFPGNQVFEIPMAQNGEEVSNQISLSWRDPRYRDYYNRLDRDVVAADTSGETAGIEYLDEIEVHPDKRSLQPYWDILTEEEKRFYSSDSPIGRAVRAKARMGRTPNSDDAKEFIKALTLGPLDDFSEVLSIPGSLVAEGIAQIKGDPYDYSNVLPRFNTFNNTQRSVSQTAADEVKWISDKTGIPEWAVGFGVDFGTDPLTWTPLVATKAAKVPGLVRSVASATKSGIKKLPSKINPRYYNPTTIAKGDPERYFRTAGKNAFEDFASSGVLRTQAEITETPIVGLVKTRGEMRDIRNVIKEYNLHGYTHPTQLRAPYFSRGKITDITKGADDYLFRTRPERVGHDAFTKAQHHYIYGSGNSRVPIGQWGVMDGLQRSADNFDVFKKSWWHGYKPVPIKQKGGQISASAGYDSWYNSPIAAGRYTFNPKDPAEYYVEGYGTKQGPGIATGMDYTNPKYRTQAMLRAGLDPEVGAGLRAQGGYRFNPIDNRREQLTWGPYGGVRFQTKDYQPGSNRPWYDETHTDLNYGVNARYNKALANRGRFSIEGDLGMGLGESPEANLGEGFDPRFYGAVKATYSPPMYKNTRNKNTGNRKSRPTTYSSGYQNGGQLQKAQIGVSVGAFLPMMVDAYNSVSNTLGNAYDEVVSWFSDEPEIEKKPLESKDVDWTKLSRPEQIDYGIQQTLQYDSPEKRKAVENLLESTAYMENRYGEDPRAYGRSYTNSFMSLDPIAVEDIFTGRGQNGAYTSSQQRYLDNMAAMGLPTDREAYTELLRQDDPRAALMAARAKYSLVPQALPAVNDQRGMFDYWLKYYNGNGILKHKTMEEAYKDFQKAYARAMAND